MSNQTLRNDAYHQIREELLMGRFAAGTKLSEPGLAKSLGLGRTPVREAIQQLELEGLVCRLSNKGTFVRVPKRRDILELYEMRIGLESYAVTLAIERISREDLLLLRALCKQISVIANRMRKSNKRKLSGPDMQQFLAADMGFHALIVSATNNQQIIKVVCDSHVLSQIFGTQRQEHSLEVVDAVCDMHYAILQAIEDKDCDKARDLVIEHIKMSQREALEHLESQANQPLSPGSTLKNLPLPASLIEEFDRMESVTRLDDSDE